MQPEETRPGITPELIVTTAMQLAGESGMEAVSMRRIAKALGIQAMSLYHHVSNREELLDLMVDTVFAEISLPKETGNWQDSIRQRCNEVRTTLLGHPWALPLLDSRKSPGAATLTHHNAVLGILRKAGFSVTLAGHAYSVLDSYIYGFVIQEIALPFNTSQETETVVTEITHSMGTELPWLAELAQQSILKPDYSYATEFSFGLELIINGLQQALERGGPT